MKKEPKSVPVQSIDEYLEALPENARNAIKKLRKTIKSAAPKAEEVISYQMPAFRFHGILVYFAAHKNHIGFYPTSSGIAAFKKELSDYEGSKGTVKFPIDKPIPLVLIGKIVKFRVNENLRKAKAKSDLEQ